MGWTRVYGAEPLVLEEVQPLGLWTLPVAMGLAPVLQAPMLREPVHGRQRVAVSKHPLPLHARPGRSVRDDLGGADRVVERGDGFLQLTKGELAVPWSQGDLEPGHCPGSRRGLHELVPLGVESRRSVATDGECGVVDEQGHGIRRSSGLDERHLAHDDQQGAREHGEVKVDLHQPTGDSLELPPP